MGRWEEANKLGLQDPAPDEEMHRAAGKKLGLPPTEIAKRVRNTYICYQLTQFREL